MNSTEINHDIWGFQVLYKATLELYDNYFRKLELALKYAKNDEKEKIQLLTTEAEKAMREDMEFFEQALEDGPEKFHELNKPLKVQTLFKAHNSHA